MSEYVFKLPDLGEGTVESEIAEWFIKVGDHVNEEDIVGTMMTDKAAVELSSPVSGKVMKLAGEPGDIIAVGAALVTFETEAATPAMSPANGNGAETGARTDTDVETDADVGAAFGSGRPYVAEHRDVRERPSRDPASAKQAETNAGVGAASSRDPARTEQAQADADVGAASSRDPARTEQAAPSTAATSRTRVMASPAIRRRAKEAGIDLAGIPGTGPGGRVTREDFDAYVAEHRDVREQPGRDDPDRGWKPLPRETVTREIKVIGVRRLIAERMAQATREIPHFTYVEEIDITELEALRKHLNEKMPAHSERLTLLPFLGMALISAIRRFPQCNATYDKERNVLLQHGAVHLGIATQTPDGLKVPVVHHAEALSLAELGQAIRRVSAAARDNSARKDELTGSTITITSLGKLGGIVSTPVINLPEVGIIGVNRAAERPVVVNGQIAIRLMMNLSSSFDHRFVDGYDAAAMIQLLKEMLEHPATIFLP